MYLYNVQKIQKLTYQKIDFNKYDLCIKNAVNSRTEAYSWYLDIVCNKNWEILVLGNYKAVMPIPIRKKYFITYVYNPMWILQLGVFYTDANLDIYSFLEFATKKYKLIDLRLNIKNKLDKSTILKQKETHYIDLTQYENHKSNFRSDRKKDLKKAKKFGLYPKWQANLDEFIQLYGSNLMCRSKNITQKDIFRIKKLLKTCIQKEKGELLSIYDSENKLVSSGFFLKHSNTVTILVSTTDLKNRKNGANTYLIDNAMFKYKNTFKYFDFGGSSIPSIANYFLSFSAKTSNYFQVKYNNLPLIYKIFKRK